MPGRPFPKGVSGNPKGGRPGFKPQLTIEVRSLARKLFDRDYWERKYAELHAGTCHPKIESTLLSYAYGLPVREVHATGTVVHLGPLQALQQLQAEEDQQGTLDAAPLPLSLSASQTRSQPPQESDHADVSG